MSGFSSVASLAHRMLLELVAPTTCAACDAPVASNVVFCPLCAASLERIAPTESSSRHVAGFEYGGAIATSIARLKYEDRADLGTRLGFVMAQVAARLEHPVDLVVPVPLHPRRLAQRGYNQSALLASPVARALGATFATDALARRRDTPRQATLERTARLDNLEGAFSASHREVDGARILLVDDVRTTGATLCECERALHEVGARNVQSLVLARRA